MLQLSTVVGTAEDTRARILAEVGDMRRYPTSFHFASANGTAPIPGPPARWSGTGSTAAATGA